jgi:hypothetical protein
VLTVVGGLVGTSFVDVEVGTEVVGTEVVRRDGEVGADGEFVGRVDGGADDAVVDVGALLGPRCRRFRTPRGWGRGAGRRTCRGLRGGRVAAARHRDARRSRAAEQADNEHDQVARTERCQRDTSPLSDLATPACVVGEDRAPVLPPCAITAGIPAPSGTGGRTSVGSSTVPWPPAGTGGRVSVSWLAGGTAGSCVVGSSGVLASYPPGNPDGASGRPGDGDEDGRVGHKAFQIPPTDHIKHASVTRGPPRSRPVSAGGSDQLRPAARGSHRGAAPRDRGGSRHRVAAVAGDSSRSPAGAIHSPESQ